MTIRQETAFYALSDPNPDCLIAVAKVDSGALLVVHENGTALGTDGHMYTHVSQEVADDEYRELGWLMDGKTPITFTREENPACWGCRMQ